VPLVVVMVSREYRCHCRWKCRPGLAGGTDGSLPSRAQRSTRGM